MQITLKKIWTTSELIGGGGFGRVYKAKSKDGDSAVIKLVPKAPGAQRELLFVDLGDTPNVVPIIDSGETETDWVLVMPKADKSLREHIVSGDHILGEDTAKLILSDVADALIGLEQNNVVHRDLKPENILYLEGKWCLADFGISRYAEATTAPDTQKFSMTAAYAAPERWRNERATHATDIYSLGVIAYELLTGSRPFLGPEVEDYREQHLHSEPAALSGLPPNLSALIDECLNKASRTRPSASSFKSRLERTSTPPRKEGLARLQEANREEVSRRSEAARRESEAQTVAEQRQEIVDAARRSYLRISEAFGAPVMEAAPAATVNSNDDGSWVIRLGQAELRFNSLEETSTNPWHGWEAPSLHVIAHTSVEVWMPPNQFGYGGRSHSLWYCDAQQEEHYNWYETAFMRNPLMRGQRSQYDPFARGPGLDSAKALWRGIAEYQVAWPFISLQDHELDEFIGRWAEWLAAASTGALNFPSTMPERETNGTWR